MSEYFVKVPETAYAVFSIRANTPEDALSKIKQGKGQFVNFIRGFDFPEDRKWEVHEKQGATH